jgi:cell division protein ZapE
MLYYESEFIIKEVNLKEEIQEFTLAPRYDSCRFETYIPDKNYPSQEKALRVLRNVSKRLNLYINSNILKKYIMRRNSSVRALYLDGQFGIGKTHLLAAFYHSFVGKKIYLSFSDLMYYISFYGLDLFVKKFHKINLICIDEFELDDPGNTMKAGNFIRSLLPKDIFFITTSNTVPGELGKGRFSAKSFENEIGSIATIFKNIKIDGKDYRLQGKNTDFLKPISIKRDGKDLGFKKLDEILKTMPQIEYKTLIKSEKEWHITGVTTFTNQDLALRFSYFIDKVYDLNFNLTTEYAESDELFPEEFLNGPYEKKYKRCLSRLHEMTNNYINNNLK